LPSEHRELWESIASCLQSQELKTLVFQKLSTDLSARFGVSKSEVMKIHSHAKPSLFRDLDGYEIAPHPDGRAKIVTMPLYLPKDRSQLELGTALYQRRFKSLKGLYSWHGRRSEERRVGKECRSGRGP